MSAPDPAGPARRWLTPGPSSPWRFDEAGEVLCWADGETVAFRAEIEAVLRRVARGLDAVPPFPAIAILLSAARAEGRRLPEERWDALRDTMESAAPWLFARVAAVKEVAETAVALRAIESVPAEVFERPDALPLLVEAVLEGAELRRDRAEAEAFLRALDLAPTPGSAAPEVLEPGDEAGAWGEGLAALRRGLARFDPAALARRARTGLDGEVVPAEIEWPDGERVRGLLESLRGDADLGAVAQLALDAMAAVRLPRPGRLPEDLPIGGYADLANRGSPERLLVSELAHDGLTLAVRIALREALYLRREAPPRAPHGARTILLDSGIRLWGVGRVFATAVGLALAAAAPRGTSVRAWRAAGSSVERVDLGTREGIDEHLAALRPEPHPAEALRGFLAACSDVGGPAECCVVTHARSLGEPAVREALRAAGRVVHVAAVTAEGDVALHAFSGAGSQCLRTARLELDRVVAAAAPPRRPPSLAALRDPARDLTGLPAILRLDRLPLRVPSPLADAQFREAPGHGVVARTHDRRLVLWTDPVWGPVEIADRTPSGALRDFRVIDETVHIVTASGASSGTAWMRADLREGIVETFGLPSIGRTPSAAVVFGDAGESVGLVSGRSLHIVTADDPSRVHARVPLPPGAVPVHGRYFRRAATGDWWRLGAVGPGRLFETVRIPRGSAGHIAWVFDRAGHDGPWAVLRAPWRVVDLSKSPPEERPLPDLDRPSIHFVAVASSGSRLHFRDRDAARSIYVNLSRGAVCVAPAAKAAGFVEPMIEALDVRTLHRRARGIGRTADGLLLIDGQRLGLHSSGALQFESVSQRGADAWRQFARSPGRLSGRHWRLDRATWDDGSSAFADSRGMVHLVSSDRSVPEVTLVRDVGATAAWCSDGTTHGPPYFLEDGRRVAGEQVFAHVRRFLERLR